ncbi:hypothetical protein, partial [Maribacter orientalis]|uniref:hypothetical protein n=1 Tax=Maribacter orientalis TaxID=228957 RepID=UPI001C4348AE
MKRYLYQVSSRTSKSLFFINPFVILNILSSNLEPNIRAEPLAYIMKKIPFILFFLCAFAKGQNIKELYAER